MDAEDPSLWKNHVQLVRKFALKLAKTEKADKEIVEIAALLHDIGKCKGRENHHITGVKLAKEFLKKIGLPGKKKKLILKCIKKHRSRFALEENEMEVKIIQSADALATLFNDEWQEHCRKTLPKEKLLELYDKSLNKLNLKSARKIGLPQIQKLKKLL